MFICARGGRTGPRYARIRAVTAVVLAAALLAPLPAEAASSGGRPSSAAASSSGSRPTTWLPPHAPAKPSESPKDAVVAAPAKKPSKVKISTAHPAPKWTPQHVHQVPMVLPGGDYAPQSGTIVRGPHGRITAPAFLATPPKSLARIQTPGSPGSPAPAPTKAAVTPETVTDPGPVTGLTATAGNAVVNLSWTMPADDGGAPIGYTDIDLYDASSGDYEGYDAVAAPATTATISQLTDGESYYVVVYVQNSWYYYGPETQSADFTPQAGPQPGPPADAYTIGSDSAMTVYWSAPSDDGGSPVTGYVVTAYDGSGDEVGGPVDAGASATSATVTGLTDGVYYDFTVAAVNANGTGPAADAGYNVPGAPPGPPTDIQVVPSDGELDITWQPPVDDGGLSVYAYVVYVLFGGVIDGSASTYDTQALISGLNDGVQYDIEISAENQSGAGPEAVAVASTPEPTNVSGLTQLPPAITDSTNLDELPAQGGAIVSGSGRYIAYDESSDSLEPWSGLGGGENRYQGETIVRYDTVTGDTVTASYDPAGALMPGIQGPAAISYDGNYIAFGALDAADDEMDTVYVRDISTGTTVAAMTGRLDGSVELAADGGYVFAAFNGVESEPDLPAASTCSQEYGDLIYRYDIATGAVNYVNLNAKGDLLNAAQPLICNSNNHVGFGSQYSVSADGDSVIVTANVWFDCVIPVAGTTYSFTSVLADQPVVTTYSGGAWTAKVFTGLDSSPIGDPCTVYDSQFQDPELPYDAGTAYIEVTTDNTTDSFYNDLYQFSTSDMTGPGTADASLTDGEDMVALSGATGEVAIVQQNMGSEYDLKQVVAVDTQTGSQVLLSQYDGQPGDSDSSAYGDYSIDAAGYTVTFDTFSGNLLGLSCGTECGAGNSIIDHIAPMGGVGAWETWGCDCGDSLGLTDPLTDYAGDPVDTATGNYTETSTDLQLAGAGLPFDLQRTYNSEDKASGPLGPGWAMSYSMSLSTAPDGDVTVTAEDGAQGIFRLMPDGSYLADPGIDSTLAATSAGYALTTPSGQVDEFTAAGALTGMVDRTGAGLSFAYNGSELASVTDTEGRTAEFSYGSGGLLSKVALPDGRSTSYGYDPSGRLTSYTDTAGQTTKYAYDGASSRITTVTNPDGTVAADNGYDETTGRVVSQQTDNGAGTSSLAWNAAAQEATYTLPDGGVEQDYYQGNVLVKHVDPDGGVTLYAYDGHMDLTSETDPDGNMTTYTYDPAGHLLTETSPAPLSYTQSWTYDSNGDVLSHTDGNGKTSHFSYNANATLASSIDPDGDKTTYTSDPDGRLLTETSPRGNLPGADAADYTTTYSYDAAGNVTAVTDPLGDKTTYTYYPATNLLDTVVSPRGNVAGADAALYTTTYTYDPAGRVLTETDPDGNVTTNAYNGNGQLEKVIDGAGNTTQYAYDAEGRVVKVTDPDGDSSSVVYDGDGNVASTTDPAGDETSMVYDAADRLYSVTSPDGNVAGADPADYTTVYGYDPDGLRTLVTDPLGEKTSTRYDALGRPTLVTDPAGDKTATAYDADGDTVSTTDPDGDKTVYGYDDADREVSSTDPVGEEAGDPAAYTTAYGYDADGDRTSETTPLGDETTSSYNADGQLVSTTDPRGNLPGADAAAFTTTYSYDADGDQSATLDGLGNKTTYTYDGAGNKVSTTSPLGNLPGADAADYTTSYVYDPDNRLVTTTDPLGHDNTTHYNNQGLVGWTEDALGDKTSYTFDPDGHRISATAPLGNVSGADAADYTTSYGYDADGNQDSVTEPPTAADPAPEPTTTSYDALNRARVTTDPLGYQTTTTYNDADEVASVQNQLDDVTGYGYDAAGNKTSTTAPLGNVPGATAATAAAYTTGYGYNADGAMTSETLPSGAETTWTYNADGQLSGSTDPRGNATGAVAADYTTGYGYDAAGNRTTVTDPLGNQTVTAYDADNEVASVTDPLKNITGYGYNADGELTSVTDPLKNATQYGYDDAGNLITRTDANQDVTRYGYNNADELTSVEAPMSNTDSYSYNADGAVDSATDARGIVTTATIDSRDEVTGLSYTGSTPSVSYNYNVLGEQVGITDATGSRTLTYNKAGELLTETAPEAGANTGAGAGGGEFSYTYNADGVVNSRSYPDGQATTYGYDTSDQVTSQTTAGATVSYGYDPAGNLTSTTLPSGNGYAQNATYNADNQVTSIATQNTSTSAALSSEQYTYNDDGQPTGLATVRGGLAQDPQSYGYDADGRLNSWCTMAVGTTGCPAGSSQTTYSYDNVGNRTAATSGGSTTSYSYNADDELTSSTAGQTSQSYSYDADGNYTGDGSSTDAITYDANNRPISAVQGSTSYTFVNDAEGNRVQTYAGGSLTQTELWDENGAVAQLATAQTGGGALIGDYESGPAGEQVSEQTSAGDYYDSVDALGSVTGLTSSTGADEIENSYTPQGIETTTDLASNAPQLPYGYAGSLTDSALTGLGQMGAREYDAATGLFTTTDPLTPDLTDPYASSYVYADDQPTDLVDPTGDSPQSSNSGGSGAAGGGGSYPGNSGDELYNVSPNHNYAEEMAYNQLASMFGVANTYADLPGFYGPVGKLWQIEGAGRTGGKGEPDLAVQNRPVAPGKTGWWFYEIKPASQAGAEGTRFGNGSTITDQLNRYVNGVNGTVVDGVQVWARAGDNVIIPDSEINYANGTVVTIFTAGDWATYGQNYKPPINSTMQGLIFYSSFRPKKSPQQSKQFVNALPSLELAADRYGIGVQEMIDDLLDENSVPGAGCTPTAEVSLSSLPSEPIHPLAVPGSFHLTPGEVVGGLVVVTLVVVTVLQPEVGIPLDVDAGDLALSDAAGSEAGDELVGVGSGSTAGASSSAAQLVGAGQ